jgi:hypothetical protein
MASIFLHTVNHFIGLIFMCMDDRNSVYWRSSCGTVPGLII